MPPEDVTMISPGLKLTRGAGGDSSSGKAKARATQYDVMSRRSEKGRNGGTSKGEWGQNRAIGDLWCEKQRINGG